MKKIRNEYFIYIAVCVLTAAVVGAVSAAYRQRIEQTALNEKTQYLQQISAQGTSIVASKLTNARLAVSSVAKYIEGAGGDLFSKSALSGIHSVAVTNNFENMSVVDKSGNVYHTINDIPINISDRFYFTDFIMGDTVISDIIEARDDGNSVIVVGAPVKCDGEVIGGVIARYPSESVQSELEKNLVGNNIRCYICHGDGDVFGAAKLDADENKMTNILTDLQQSAGTNESVMLRVKSDMENYRRGSAEVTYSEKKFLINYEPVGINDLFCVAMMPYDAVMSNIDYAAHSFVWIWAVSTAAMLVILLLFAAAAKKYRTRYESTDKRLNVICDSIPSGIMQCSCDSLMRVEWANKDFYSVIGMGEAEFADSCDCDFARLTEGGVENIIDRIAPDEAFSAQKCIKYAEKEIHIAIRGRLVKGENGEADRLLCTLTDISRCFEMKDEICVQKKRCELLTEQIRDIVFEWDCDKKQMTYSKYFGDKFGYEPQINDFPEGFINLGMVYREDRQRFLNLFATINMGSAYSEDELRIRKNDGTYLWCRMCIMAVRGENKQLRRIIGAVFDIDEQKRQKDGMDAASVHDALTGLYNKRVTELMISESLNHISCSAGALMIIDIDNFKSVNELLGNDVGDETLKAAAERIRGLFREDDIIGRVGGDEIVVFMRNIKNRQIADYKAQCIVQMMDHAVADDNGDAAVQIGANVGIAFYPDDALTYSQLYSKADKALYYSKRNEKACVSTYDRTL